VLPIIFDAATAIANGLPVYTCNPRDFRGITDLEVVAVAHPDAEGVSQLPDTAE
jgi:hypothetical protein